jgi:hypothetical protein
MVMTKQSVLKVRKGLITVNPVRHLPYISHNNNIHIHNLKLSLNPVGGLLLRSASPLSEVVLQPLLAAAVVVQAELSGRIG